MIGHGLFAYMPLFARAYEQTISYCCISFLACGVSTGALTRAGILFAADSKRMLKQVANNHADMS